MFTHKVLLEAFSLAKDFKIVVFKDASLAHFINLLDGILALLVIELVELTLILRGEFNVRHQVHHLVLSVGVDELSSLLLVLLIHLLLRNGSLGSNLIRVVRLALKLRLLVGDEHQVVE